MSWEVTITHLLDGKPLEHTRLYDSEPSVEQIAAQKDEAKKTFTREAKRRGVTVDDPGVTPTAQPVDDGGPGAKRRAN